MLTRIDWDWEPGSREIADIGGWQQKFNWVEEPYVSPNGENIAAVVNLAGATRTFESGQWVELDREKMQEMLAFWREHALPHEPFCVYLPGFLHRIYRHRTSGTQC